MSRVVERTCERTVRVAAPLWGLYRQIETAPGLARFVPEIERAAPGDAEERARVLGSLPVGPLSYRLTGDLAVRRVDPPYELELFLRADELSLELEGTFALSVASAEETTVRYTAALRSTHPVVRRMGATLRGVLDEHVAATTDLLGQRVRQYAAATRRFPRLRRPR